VIATGVPTGGALEKCAKRKSDQQQLQAAVRGDAADGAFQQLEPPGLDRNTVEENDVSTIQPIGKKPTTTPSSDALTDIGAGMVYMKIVMRLLRSAR